MFTTSSWNQSLLHQNYYHNFKSSLKLVRPVCIDSCCRDCPDAKLQKFAKNYKNQNLNHVFHSFVAYWHIDHACRVSRQLQTNCRSSNLKKSLLTSRQTTIAYVISYKQSYKNSWNNCLYNYYCSCYYSNVSVGRVSRRAAPASLYKR